MSRNPFPKIANLFISNRKISVSSLEKGNFHLQVIHNSNKYNIIYSFLEISL